MKHIAAYALLVLGGNEQPSADDVKKVISACDGEVDDAQLEKLLADLADKTFAELVDSGLEKIKDIAIGGADQRFKRICSVPLLTPCVAGGGGGGGGGGAAAGGDGAAAEEAKAEENEEEEEEEIDMAGGMDMFGDDGGGDDY